MKLNLEYSFSWLEETYPDAEFYVLKEGLETIIGKTFLTITTEIAVYSFVLTGYSDYHEEVYKCIYKGKNN